MKRAISIRIDEKLWVYIKDKPNKSVYLQELIKQDLQGQQTKPIVQAVLNQLLMSEVFFDEIRARLGNSNTNSITSPSKNSNTPPNTPFVPGPPDPNTGYPCCQAKKPCKHWVFDGDEDVWVNTLTGQAKDA